MKRSAKIGDLPGMSDSGTNGVKAVLQPGPGAALTGTFTVVDPGLYEVCVQGAGGPSGSVGIGTSGGLALARRRLIAGAALNYTAGRSGETSSIALPDVTLSVTSGLGDAGGGGVATGGDVNVNGTLMATNSISDPTGRGASSGVYQGGSPGLPGDDTKLAQSPGGTYRNVNSGPGGASRITISKISD